MDTFENVSICPDIKPAVNSPGQESRENLELTFLLDNSDKSTPGVCV